jgi:hypothetical protein
MGLYDSLFTQPTAVDAVPARQDSQVDSVFTKDVEPAKGNAEVSNKTDSDRQRKLQLQVQARAARRRVVAKPKPVSSAVSTTTPVSSSRPAPSSHSDPAPSSVVGPGPVCRERRYDASKPNDYVNDWLRRRELSAEPRAGRDSVSATETGQKSEFGPPPNYG